MELTCEKCTKWQGRRANFGDCHHILHELVEAGDEDYTDMYGTPTQYPFDPHSLIYYRSGSTLRLAVQALLSRKVELLFAGIKIDEQTEDIMDIDDKGVMRKTRKKLPYFQTFRRFGCNLYEERND